ncbi:MAG TPA: T9SS type A sorting domain-containing protein [Bacteroidales bacterium]|nr:T9SS type A sorting domain-containing protein [Bacteroidales bacterium]HSA44619.1 T9SS type A sorting domain-containing protein [Bacteroidales bacterium]
MSNNNATPVICNNEFTDIEIPYFSSIDKDRQGAIYLLSTKTANIAPLNISASWVVLGGNDGNSNHFTNCNAGLYNYNQKATVTNNTFVDCKNAIKLIEIISPTIIRENEINMTSVDEVGTGIFAANVNLKSTPDRIAISRNVITDMASGIRVINLRGHNMLPFVRIDTNLVFYSESSNPPPNPPIKTGIFAENCIYPRLRFDSISFADLEVSEEDIQRKKGIRLANVRTGTLIENHVYKAGSGIFTNGLLTNTQFLCNSLEDCFHGFYFGNYTSLSDQGYPENTQLNIPGLNPQNFFFGNYDPMLNCKLQSCDGCILNPEVRWFYQYGGSSSVLLDVGLNNSLAYEKIIPYPNIIGTNVCVLQNKDRRDTLLCDTITRESILGRILRNENFYEMLQAQYSYYDAYHLFELLGGDTSALNLGGSDDLDYRLMYDSLKNANPGAIENYYSSVDFNGLDSARYWNEHVYTNTDWDIYRKEVNNIYLNSWFINNRNLDSASRASLFSIANEIPYYYGDAVYTARVMLDLHPDDLMLPYSSPYTANQQERTSILVYPNPTFGNITITVSGEIPKSMEIRIYDIFGREVCNKRIENVQYENQIPLQNLSTGCYICRVYIAGSALTYTKVVIMGNK